MPRNDRTLADGCVVPEWPPTQDSVEPSSLVAHGTGSVAPHRSPPVPKVSSPLVWTVTALSVVPNQWKSNGRSMWNLHYARRQSVVGLKAL